ncbi:MAG: glycosyltransferase family 4 protein, partial [Maribacter sp.]|nr:glycosyltransferase family 4 protein [Maribacter sp.]
ANAGKERLLVDVCKVNDYKSNPLTVIIINDVVDDALLSTLKGTGARVIELKRKPRGQKFKFILLIRSILKRFKPHVIHMHEDLSLFFGLIGSIGMHNRKIFTLHEVNFYSCSLKDRISKFLAIKLIDRYIAIASSVKTNFDTSVHTNRGKVIVVHNGISLEKFKRAESLSRLDDIICVARLYHKHKGQDLLIRALAILRNEGRNCYCRFVGEGSSRKYLEKMVEEYELTNSIEFLGNKDDIPELLCNSGIFILPSRYEGFGVSIIEAMSIGIPVIASNIDGPKEIITHGENGLLFESNNARDLVEKIVMLMNDCTLRTTIVNNALLTAQDYSIEKTYNGYISVYNSS